MAITLTSVNTANSLRGFMTLSSIVVSSAASKCRRLLLVQLREVASKDAAFVVAVMQLGAEDFLCAMTPQVKLGRKQHPQRRSCEIDPKARPHVRGYCRAERARRVHAHSRQRRFKADKRRDQQARNQTGIA